PAELLQQLPADADLFVNSLERVDREPDGPSLVGDAAADTLANPPRGVGRKLIAAAPLELHRGPHQADVALLNQIQELQSAIGVLLGDGHNQTEVCRG